MELGPEATLADPAGSKPGGAVVIPIDRKPTERCIPIRTGDLIRLLTGDPALSPAERLLLQRFARLLRALICYQFHGWLDELKECYAPIDPDTDCVRVEGGSLARTEHVDEQFLKVFEATLIRANYRPLDLAVIEQAIESPNELGLNYLPNFDLFEHMKLYVRGHSRVVRTVRSPRSFFRKKAVEFDAYQRLVIALKFKPGEEKVLGPFVRTDVLYLRLFKDVPHVDMEMHLPEQGTRVVMRAIDKAQIASPLMVGLPTFAFKLLTASLISPMALGAVMIAPLSAGLNSFFGFQRAKQRHLHHMIRNLYYLTLANNASVIQSIVSAAEDEEFKEAFLAYQMLRRHADDAEPWTQPRLDRRIETFLREAVGISIDFEIGDALGKLERFGLLRRDPDGSLHALPLEYALPLLDERWDHAFRNTIPPEIPAPKPV